MDFSNLHGIKPSDTAALLHRLQGGFVKAKEASTRAMPGDHVSVSWHACLVLERWSANPLADWLLERHPVLADARVGVPDEIYKDRPDAAPTLVPLPSDWASETPCAQTQQVLESITLMLESALQQVRRRMIDQSLCAVVFSPATPEAIATHWTHLGFQTSPVDSNDKLFHYQDARVMQRVWPVLDDAQRLQWLGPVTEWWSLAQPWGPWSSAEVFDTNEDEGGKAEGRVENTAGHPPEWFIASRFAQALALQQPSRATQSREAMRHLLHLSQWHAAHSAPAANRAWFDMASRQVPVQRQPDDQTMTHLLGHAAEMGLIRESDFADFVDASWRVDAHDGRALRDWSVPEEAAVLRHALALMRQAPDAFGFAAALYQAQQMAAGRMPLSRKH